MSPRGKLILIDENINKLKENLRGLGIKEVPIKEAPKSEKFVLPSQEEINKYPRG